MIITGVSWNGASPHLRLQAPEAAGTPESHLVPATGFELSFRHPSTPVRHCLGHHRVELADGRARIVAVACASVVGDHERRCHRCAISEAIMARDLHHAHTRPPDEIDPAMLVHLRQPNVLYLAAFRDGSVKVGTSRSGRLATRLHEQGAWLARLCAEFEDGLAVRRAEDTVTAELAIPQSVSIGRKLAGHHRPRPDAELSAMLDRHGRDVGQLVAATEPGDTEPGGARTWQARQVGLSIWRTVHAYPAGLSTGAHELRVLDLSGRIALVEPLAAGSDRFVTDLGVLYGLELDWGRHGSAPLAIQGSLF